MADECEVDVRQYIHVLCIIGYLIFRTTTVSTVT